MRLPLFLALSLLVAGAPLHAEEAAQLDEARGEVALLGRALEAYPSPSDFVKIRAALFSVSGEAARPHFETREKALRSVYRTLAAVDYTRARDLPAKCSPEERRAAILRHDDGLLAGPDGKLTPWFAAVLGLERAGEAPKEITAAASVTDRAKALARVEELSKTLSQGDVEPAARAEALCERAGLYESLAVTSAGEVEASAPIEAGFSVPPVHGSCAAFCDGPPRPSYSGGGGSSGYSTTWGPVLGQAIGNLIGQGIRKLFEPRPARVAPQRSYAQSAPQQVRPYELPPPPPDPPKKPRVVTGLTITPNKIEVPEGQTVTLVAQLTFEGEVGSISGIQIALPKLPDRIKLVSATPSDDNGRAEIQLFAEPDAREQQFDDLKREEQRARGETPDARPKSFLAKSAPARDVTKNRANSAFDALDSESPADNQEAEEKTSPVFEAAAPTEFAREGSVRLAQSLRFSVQGTRVHGSPYADVDLAAFAGTCPEGSVAIPSGSGRVLATPGHVSSGDAQSIKDAADCDQVERAADQACGPKDIPCRSEVYHALWYKWPVCRDRIEKAAGAGWSHGSVIAVANRPITYRCVPKADAPIGGKSPEGPQSNFSEGDAEAALGGSANTPAKETAEAAAKLGFTRRIPAQKAPFDSHGQPVFQKGNRYITRDVDSHKGGVWKMFNRYGERLGTYDANLDRIGD